MLETVKERLRLIRCYHSATDLVTLSTRFDPLIWPAALRQLTQVRMRLIESILIDYEQRQQVADLDRKSLDESLSSIECQVGISLLTDALPSRAEFDSDCPQDYNQEEATHA